MVCNIVAYIPRGDSGTACTMFFLVLLFPRVYTKLIIARNVSRAIPAELLMRASGQLLEKYEPAEARSHVGKASLRVTLRYTGTLLSAMMSGYADVVKIVSLSLNCREIAMIRSASKPRHRRKLRVEKPIAKLREYFSRHSDKTSLSVCSINGETGQISPIAHFCLLRYSSISTTTSESMSDTARTLLSFCREIPGDETRRSKMVLESPSRSPTLDSSRLRLERQNIVTPHSTVYLREHTYTDKNNRTGFAHCGIW